MFEKLNEGKGQEKILLIVNILLVLFFFVSFVHSDLYITTKHSLTFWDALFSGRLKDFYVMNESVLIPTYEPQICPAVYDFPIYFVFAIWNFPLWVYEQVTGICALNTVAGVLWAKGTTIPFLVAIFFSMKRIRRELNPENRLDRYMLLSCLNSVLFFVPYLIMGQYDAPALLCILLGVEHYIEDDKKMFIFWFAVAATFKLFALFIFIPLVLLRTKRISRILLYLFTGCSLLLACKIAQASFFTDSEVSFSYVRNQFLPYIFQSQIGFVYGASSIFVIGFMLVCMYVFFLLRPEKKLKQNALYVGFLSLSVFFITSLTHPQWSLLLLPFSILLIFSGDELYQKAGLLIDTIFSAGLLLTENIYYFRVFNIKAGAYLLPGKIFSKEYPNLDYSIKDLIANHLPGVNIDYFNLIGGGIFVAGVIFFIYWANSNIRGKRFNNIEISISSILWIRTAIMLIVGLLLFWICR